VVPKYLFRISKSAPLGLISTAHTDIALV